MSSSRRPLPRGNRRAGPGKQSNQTQPNPSVVRQPTSRFYNQVAARPQQRRNLNPQIQVAMTTHGNILVSSASVPVFGTLSFTVGGFSQASEYLSLFDQYRIDEVEVWLEPTAPIGLAMYPQFVSCIDYDDSSAPSSFSALASRQQSLDALGGVGHYHVFKPRVAMAAYSGAFSSFANMAAPWIDSGSNSVVHYGVKAGADASGSLAVTYRYTARALVSFRQPGI
jgi:hypothetical protein